MERVSIGPLLDMLRISLRGIKYFEAKKVDKPYWFLKSNIPILTQNSINGKSLTWTPTGYATHLPSGETFSRMNKDHCSIVIFKV